ncbi:MAG: hypothetical protein ACOCXQ_00180 [Patescibacteria group bacterium]
MKKTYTDIISSVQSLLESKPLRIILLLLALCLIILFPGRQLLPTDSSFFEYHDATQAARIHDFVLNLQNGQVPPRIAPTFYYQMGFPVYNYYAPFAYWVTSGFVLLGLSIISALKLSFLLTLTGGFLTMFAFLQRRFSFYPAIAGAAAYASSPYFAVDMVVRGNLGECWFLVLFPLALYLIEINSQSKKRWVFVLTAVILSFTFSVHNIFSLFSLPLLLLYSLLFSNRWNNMLAIALGLGGASYFLFPAVMENHLTQSVTQATSFIYSEHFLCPWQIWHSNWDFGPSLPGCDEDYMSFSLGKHHLLLGAAGVLIFVIQALYLGWRAIIKKEKVTIASLLVPMFFFFILIGFTFLTTYQSAVIWNALEQWFAVFQFPWRFLIFGMFGLAFFIAYLIHSMQKGIMQFEGMSVRLPLPVTKGMPLSIIAGAVMICISLIFISKRYYYKPPLEQAEYQKRYISEQYRAHGAAYNMKEYFSEHVDVENLLQTLYHGRQPVPFDYTKPTEGDISFKVVENSHFTKVIEVIEPGTLTLNIHYFPYWLIQSGDKYVIPQKFDLFGRPILSFDRPTRLTVTYQQTTIQLIGNTMTVGTILVLLHYLFLGIPRNIYTKIKSRR